MFMLRSAPFGEGGDFGEGGELFLDALEDPEEGAGGCKAAGSPEAPCTATPFVLLGESAVHHQLDTVTRESAWTTHQLRHTVQQA